VFRLRVFLGAEMKITLVEISREFKDSEVELLKQNCAVLNQVFEEVSLVLVQNANTVWDSEIVQLNPKACLTGPEDKPSAAANRHTGALASDQLQDSWSLFLDADMELLPAFAKFLRDLAPSGPELALCDRIDRNPATNYQKRVRPIFIRENYLSLYGAFATRGLSVADCISLVDDLEEQWLLRNIKQKYPAIVQCYLPEIGIIHHDAKDMTTRMGRYIFEKRCIGFWQGLALKYRDKLEFEDMIFLFRGRNIVQKSKLGVAIFFSFFPFIWRQINRDRH
jgi:hypothetical protein